jgi:hypothetical protein
LRGIFGPKRDEVTGEWRKLHNVELNDRHSSPNIVLGDEIEKSEMGMSCSAYGGEERHRWEDNIKMDLQEVGCGVWTGLSCLRIGRGFGHL